MGSFHYTPQNSKHKIKMKVQFILAACLVAAAFAAPIDNFVDPDCIEEDSHGSWHHFCVWFHSAKWAFPSGICISCSCCSCFLSSKNHLIKSCIIKCRRSQGPSLQRRSQ